MLVVFESTLKGGVYIDMLVVFDKYIEVRGLYRCVSDV